MKALKSVFDDSNYLKSIEFFENKSTDPETDSTTSAKAQGFLRSLLSFEFYFIISAVIEIFEGVETVNIELQQKELCVNESHAIVRALMYKIKKMRDVKKFSQIWQESLINATNLGVDELVLKRQRNAPKSYEHNPSSESYVFISVEDYYRKLYFQIVDQTLVSLNARFQSDTIALLNKFENFVAESEEIDVKEITDLFNIEIIKDGKKYREKEIDG